MFGPLHHAPGHAQVDFGEADIYVQGVLERAHFFVMDLPHSDDAFVMAFPAETTEALCKGYQRAFLHFGGGPLSILYDNPKLAVAQIQDAGRRQTPRAFRELPSHYLFAERFGRPGQGNEKGKGEGLVGYARRNFLVPLPRVSRDNELNQQLLRACQQRRAKVRRAIRTLGNSRALGNSGTGRPIWPWRWVWRLVRKAIGCASRRPRDSSTSCWKPVMASGSCGHRNNWPLINS